MPTGKDIKRTSSQVMELKDLISGPLAATIDADSIATRRYLSYLMELAFESYDKETGKVGELRMLEFNYQSHDVDGTHQQQVKIPLLTLVPLPLLQVKEADFDFDIQIVDALGSKLEDELHNGGGLRVRLDSAIGAFAVAVGTDFALILAALHLGVLGALGLDGHIAAVIFADEILEQIRSEERRVGKECRSRWSPYH